MDFDLNQFWRTINSLVTVIRREGDHAVIKCPSGRDHQDVWLHLNCACPYVSCFHPGCQPDVQATNEAVREALNEAFPDQVFNFSPDKKQEAVRKRLWQTRTVAKARILPRLTEKGPITREDWLRASPYDVSRVPVEDHWKLMIELFRPYVERICDHIWCGKLADSGGPGFAWHFKTVDQWLREDLSPGPQICQCLFAPDWGGISIQRHGSRGDKWPSLNPWRVLESDDLPAEQFGQVILYAIEELGLKLKAVVDTGKKSIHAWLPWPKAPEGKHYRAFQATIPADFWSVDREHCNYGREAADRYWDGFQEAWDKDKKATAKFQEWEAATLATLRGLTCDHKLWRVNATARLPGCPRLDDGDDGSGEPILDAQGQPRWQRLIYYDPS